MIITDLYTSQAVALYVTNAPTLGDPYRGKAYFPDRKKYGMDISWFEINNGLNVALKPSNFDALPPLRMRGKFETVKEQMPFFRESMIVKELDLMKLAEVSDSNGEYAQQIVNSWYDDANRLVDGAEIVAEIMRMSLLAPLNGNMGISVGLEDNTKYVYNYDGNGAWKSNNYMELTSSDKWDNPTTSKPLNDITEAIQYLASTGYTATTILSNSNTFNYLIDNDQIKNALLSITGKSIDFTDKFSVNEVLSRKTGLVWDAYDKMYQDYDGTKKKFYPDNYITILGNRKLGNFWRGTTPEELTSNGRLIDAPKSQADISVLSNGIAIAIQTDYKPSFTITTTVSQLGMPSFEGRDSIFVIKVA